ncbi:hypothetical protein F5050DRAFT_1711956 [Lentinula boryana]|uniref:Alpha beta-hydrolase n=1 Tax=Lentinula boryana TaxID=40481 RepID=A0ABQ8QDK6_9AGAR|nr:hypothetical protein F5050DRAFT_1711956 [Lentinula boryana]
MSSTSSTFVNLTYKTCGKVPITLDVYPLTATITTARAKAKNEVPAVLWFHGGGFTFANCTNFFRNGSRSELTMQAMLSSLQNTVLFLQNQSLCGIRWLHFRDPKEGFLTVQRICAEARSVRFSMLVPLGKVWTTWGVTSVAALRSSLSCSILWYGGGFLCTMDACLEKERRQNSNMGAPAGTWDCFSDVLSLAPSSWRRRNVNFKL